jgi:hypothetical protein
VVQVSIRANPEASVQVFAAGEEGTCIVVIDDFVLDTGDIIRYAAESAGFERDGTYVYPGVRARPPREYSSEIARVIAPLLGQVYSLPGDRKVSINAFYSLVATPPGQLAVMQRLPHFDSNRPHFFAVTHYLNPGKFGGTGLFRHKPTGFENITEDRLAAYARAGDAFLRAHGDPPPEYIRKSTDHFELFEQIEYRPNRLVAYPGTVLHSGLIDPGRDISSDPVAGRLTANFFMEFQ